MSESRTQSASDTFVKFKKNTIVYSIFPISLLQLSYCPVFCPVDNKDGLSDN